jgi:hypothetical protein
MEVVSKLQPEVGRLTAVLPEGPEIRPALLELLKAMEEYDDVPLGAPLEALLLHRAFDLPAWAAQVKTASSELEAAGRSLIDAVVRLVSLRRTEELRRRVAAKKQS